MDCLVISGLIGIKLLARTIAGAQMMPRRALRRERTGSPICLVIEISDTTSCENFIKSLCDNRGLVYRLISGAEHGV